MYLKKLALAGFKSFAEPVELEFSKGVSAIVGPNGSGKSNITDAIRCYLLRNREKETSQLRRGHPDLRQYQRLYPGQSGRDCHHQAAFPLRRERIPHEPEKL